MAGYWKSTRDTRVAAALGSLGVEITPLKALDAGSGKREVKFRLGAKSVCGSWDTGRILKGEREGTLPAGHAYLTMLRGLENRALILDFLEKGVGIELRAVPGAEGVWEYVAAPGKALAGSLPGVPVLRTGDLKLVAALGLGGCELLQVTGSRGMREFQVRRFGPGRGSLPRVDAYGMGLEWRANREGCPMGDPVVQGLWVLRNRERVLDAVNGRGDVVMLKKDGRRATIQLDGAGNAGDGAWKQAEDFLG